MARPKKKFPKQEPIWYIKHSKLFQVLSDHEIAGLADKGQLVEVLKGSEAYSVGDPGQHVFLIKEGGIKIVSTTADGKELTLAYLGEMELFGEIALVDKSPREQRAVATQKCCLIAFPAAYIEELMSRQPTLALSITKFVGLRLKKVQMRLQNLMFRSPILRLAKLLLELAEDFGVEDPATKEVEIRFKLTHNEIASLIGVTRESVTYAMGELESKGLIRTERRKIFVHDREQLTDFAE